MIVVLRKDATDTQIDHLIEKIKKLGLTPHVSKGTERTIVGVIGPEDILQITPLEVFPGVEKVMPVLSPYKLVSREMRPAGYCHRSGKRRKDRRRANRDHGRAVRRRKPGHAGGDRKSRQKSRCSDTARRRIQTAHVSLQLSGNRRGGTAISCSGLLRP